MKTGSPETETELQPVLDSDASSTSFSKSGVLETFSSNKPPADHKRYHDSLSDTLLDAESPLAQDTGDYHDTESLTSSQIVKPAERTRRKSSIRAFVEQKQATIFSSMMNLSNTILGAGLLGLPYAISKSGWFLAIVLFCVMGCLSFIGLTLSCSAAKIKAPNASYYTLSEISVPRAKKLVDFAVAFKCFGVGTSYFVVIGDLMPDVMEGFLPSDKDDSAWTNRRLWIFVFSFIFIFPVVRFKQMDKLRFTSVISVACFAYVTLIVVLFAFGALDAGTVHNKRITAFPASDEIVAFLKVIPIYIFAFTCHQNSFTITNELKENTLTRLNMVIGNSLTLCVCIYCIVGYSGYFTFGRCVEGDILNSYPQIPAVAVVRMLLSVALAWSYPLQCHPCRKCVTSLLFDTTVDKLDRKRFYGITYGIFFGSFAVSMVVDSLSFVLEIVGSVGSPIISFILPGLFYYKITDPKLKYESYYNVKRKIALCYIIFGVLIIPFTLSMQFVPKKEEELC